MEEVTHWPSLKDKKKDVVQSRATVGSTSFSECRQPARQYTRNPNHVPKKAPKDFVSLPY